MKLTDSEIKTIHHTKTDLRLWTYTRFILLALAIFSIVFSFRLIYLDPGFLTGIGYWIRGSLLVVGVGLTVFVVRNWDAPKSRLLVKLADRMPPG